MVSVEETETLMVHGTLFIIDAEDLPDVVNIKWQLHSEGYAWAHNVGYLHRYVLRYKGPLVVDHKNRCITDCRKSNLVIATKRENGINADRSDNAGITVEQLASGRMVYRAEIYYMYRRYKLGTYRTRRRADIVRSYNLLRLANGQQLIGLKRANRWAPIKRVMIPV